jgi:DNA-binding IclR family transcriptional regulator
MSASLDRGLRLLEIIAGEEQPIGFNDLNRELGNLSRASLSRLLKFLVESDYVDKDPESGLYRGGKRLARLSGASFGTRREQLISRFGPVIKEIVREYDVTGFILERVGDLLLNIRREQTEFSIFMQPEGTLNDMKDEPWLQMLAAYCPELEKTYDDPEILKRLKMIRENGYYYEDQTKRPSIRRLAFPVFDDDKIIAVLGFGGTVSQFDDEKVKKCIEKITQTTRS